MKKTILAVLFLAAALSVFAQSGVIKQVTGSVELKNAGAAGFTAAKAGDAVAQDTIINQSSAEVHNVVTQKLAAARAGDLKALGEARDAMTSVKRGNVIINRHITDEESLVLRLETLKVACELMARPA